LCVWTKFPLENDPKTDDLTPEMRRQINAYVDKTFKSRVPAEKVRDLIPPVAAMKKNFV